MPGFNQRGPMNEGPMTGGGRGYCTGGGNATQGFAGRGNAMGMGRQRGRRGYQEAPGQGLGAGRWTGPATDSANQTTLQNSVDRLETELAELKNQLKNLSESRE